MDVEKALDSQIVGAKENLKLSHGGPCQVQASGTIPPMTGLDQGLPAMKEEIMAINNDWVYNQAKFSCRNEK